MTVERIEVPYDGWLTTLEEVYIRQQLIDNITGENIKKADAALRQCIAQASADVVAHLGWLPLPYKAERTYTKKPQSKQPDVLVHKDLLEIESFTDANDAAVSNYELRPENGFPKNTITFDTATCAWLSQGCPPSRRRYTVSGWWGYVPHYPRAWKSTGIELPSGGISDSTAEISVAEEAIDQFQTGDYIRLEDEMLWIYDRNTSGLKLLVQRGVNGTTAESHDEETEIKRFLQLDVIRTNTAEWATYLFKMMPVIGDQVQVYDSGVQVINGLSPLIKKALDKHICV